MEQTILDAAAVATERLAKALAIKPDSQDGCDYLEGYNKGYSHGAEWQKEQSKELITLMRQLIDAYDFRYPNIHALLVGYTNEEAFEKMNQLIEKLQS